MYVCIWPVLLGVCTLGLVRFKFSLGFLCGLCGFSYLGPVSVFCVYLVFLVYFLLSVLSCQYQCKWLPGKTHIWNNLLCVERDIKIYSLAHALGRALLSGRSCWWAVEQFWLYALIDNPVVYFIKISVTTELRSPTTTETRMFPSAVCTDEPIPVLLY